MRVAASAAIVDAEPLGDDALEVDPSPAHDAFLLAIRTRLDDGRELDELLSRQARLGTCRPIVDEAIRPSGVEAMNPIAQRLPIHAADPGRRARSIPSRTAANDRSRGSGSSPSNDGPAPEDRQPNSPLAISPLTASPNPPCQLNQKDGDPGIPVSQPAEPWYNAWVTTFSARRRLEGHLDT